MSMDEVIDNLWVGDFGAATSIELLEQAGVKYVVSCMRGKVRVHEVSSWPTKIVLLIFSTA
jgi:hypothetical protein